MAHRPKKRQGLLDLPGDVVEHVAALLVERAAVLDPHAVVQLSRCNRSLRGALRRFLQPALEALQSQGQTRVRWVLLDVVQKVLRAAPERRKVFFSQAFGSKAGHRWRLVIAPNPEASLSVYLCVADEGVLPTRWRRPALFSLTTGARTVSLSHTFTETTASWGYHNFLSHDQVRDALTADGALSIDCAVASDVPGAFSAGRDAMDAKRRYFRLVARYEKIMKRVVDERVQAGYYCGRCAHAFRFCKGRYVCSDRGVCRQTLWHLYANIRPSAARRAGICDANFAVPFFTDDLLPENL